MVDLELPSLISISKLELELGNISKAKDQLNEVLDVAEAGPYPFPLADAYNVLAEAGLLEGDRNAADYRRVQRFPV